MRSVGVWVALCLVLTSCAAAAGQESGGLAQQVADGTHGVRIEVLSAGAAVGRAVLTPAPALGSEHTVRTVAHRTVTFPDDRAPFDISSPRSETTSRVEITGRPPGGGFAAAGIVVAARALDQGELDAHNLIRFDRGLDAIEGSAVMARVDANGIVERSHLALPTDLSPTVHDAVLDLGTFADIAVVPVPDDAVGVGAVWVETVSDSFRALDHVTRTTYELTALDGDRYTLRVRFEQVFEGTTMEDGFELTYRGTVTGTGTVQGDVTRPTPITRDLTADGSVLLSDGKDTVEMGIDLFVDVSTS